MNLVKKCAVLAAALGVSAGAVGAVDIRFGDANAPQSMVPEGPAALEPAPVVTEILERTSGGSGEVSALFLTGPAPITPLKVEPVNNVDAAPGAPLPSVPLPAGGALLLGALAAFGFLRRLT